MFVFSLLFVLLLLFKFVCPICPEEKICPSGNVCDVCPTCPSGNVCEECPTCPEEKICPPQNVCDVCPTNFKIPFFATLSISILIVGILILMLIIKK
jgi:hypothetical protein